MGRLPHVDHTIPSNGATNVSRNLRSIQIRFDRPMKPDARLSLASDPGAFELKGASINYGVDTNTFTIKRRGTKPLPPMLSSLLLSTRAVTPRPALWT